MTNELKRLKTQMVLEEIARNEVSYEIKIAQPKPLDAILTLACEAHYNAQVLEQSGSPRDLIEARAWRDKAIELTHTHARMQQNLPGFSK